MKPAGQTLLVRMNAGQQRVTKTMRFLLWRLDNVVDIHPLLQVFNEFVTQSDVKLARQQILQHEFSNHDM